LHDGISEMLHVLSYVLFYCICKCHQKDPVVTATIQLFVPPLHHLYPSPTRITMSHGRTRKIALSQKTTRVQKNKTAKQNNKKNTKPLFKKSNKKTNKTKQKKNE